MSDHAQDDNSPMAKPLPRSIKDFATDEALREALSRLVPPTSLDNSTCGTSSSSTMSFASSSTPPPTHCPYSFEPDPEYDLDWRVDNVDRAKSHEQTVEREMNRLLVLKSYLELDYEAITARNSAFDRLAGLAKRSFNTPACFIFLLDVGRSWALSHEGKAFNAVPRKDTFCSHVIVSKEECFIVPDASIDPRFRNSAYVTAENGVRFYAACPLKSPEGVNIGTFCIVDIVPRNTFVEEDQAALKDFSRLAMDALVHQRELFRKRQELDSAARRLASASHDLLTPLSVVQLSIALLNEDSQFLDRLDPTQREYIKAVSSSSEAMAGVCQSLRKKLSGSGHDTVSISEASTAGSDELVEMADAGSPATMNGPACISTSALVERLNELAAVVITNKPVPLAISVSEFVPPLWVGNEVQILHICLHLLVNSIERTFQGQVTFAVHVDELNGQRELVFECKDSGGRSSGSEEDLEAIFDEQVLSSYSVKSQVTREHENHDGRCSPSGILSPGCVRYCELYECFPSALVNEPTLEPFSTQIRSLGGSFGVSKVPESGETTFWFSVPLLLFGDITPPSHKREHDEAIQLKSTDEHSPDDEKRRALVIDDSVIMRKMLCRALEQLGYDTFQAADGLEGLACMREQHYDLVLLDFLMPVMDGLDCVRAVRQWEKENRPGYTQSICGMSAHASPSDVERAIAVGMTDYRSKPLNMVDLRHLQETTLKRQRTEELLRQNSEFSSLAVSSDATPLCGIASEHGPPTVGQADSHSECHVPSTCEKTCLLATKDRLEAEELDGLVAETGWRFCTTQSGSEALCLLKTRNWSAVILDADLPEVDGLKCISAFREWEKDNRVHRQSNMLLMGASVKSRAPGDQMFMVQLPDGVDDAVERPANRNDLACVLNRIVVDRGFFDEHDIITWG